MVLFEWNDNYLTNIKECDEQHKKLFGLINELHEKMKNGTGKDALERILSELLDYTAYHFLTEESLFETFDYPEKETHKKEHETLTKQLNIINIKFEKGETHIAMPLATFLKDWLLTHTLQSDKKYGIFLANII
ncbi:MAG: bacteriohemerythrin [Candidatus Riflemargulisbacteria bacterium]